MARKTKKINLAEPIVGEVTDLRTDIEKQLEEAEHRSGSGEWLKDQSVEPQEPAPVMLTKDELHRLQLTQFQARAFEAERNLEMIKRDLYVRQIDPEGKLQQMMALIRGRTDEAIAAKAEYAKVTAEIEARLSISLKEWAYDDLNGQLSKVD